ncbi:MAG: glycosyltransferase [Methylacidiphilales bacterium]|nr:glycosyltransferase [Candidatus Methylacidiphilales bacterium]
MTTGRGPLHVLILSPLFPPNYVGGAEIAACELAKWLVRQGHRVSVVASCAEGAEEQHGVEEEGGMKVWRLRFHRPYSLANHHQHSGLTKLIWHLQDQADPRNLSAVARVLDEVKPDVVNIHGLQGLGHNIPLVLGARDLPVVYTLHDYAVACLKSSLHIDGKPCESLHLPCALTKIWKWHCLGKIRRLSFYSVSAAVLRELDRVLPPMPYRREVIRNPMRFELTKTFRERPDCPHFLFVGRLQDVKGIWMLLRAARRVAATHPLCLTVVGRGPEEEKLKAEFGSEPWVRFAGFVPSAEVGSFMTVADVCCLPSLWAEPASLVASQAMVMGLPIMASNTGGFPELVRDKQSGFLLPPGDEDAWYGEIRSICENPGQLQALKEGVRELAAELDQDLLGAKVVELYEWTMAQGG